MARRVEDLALLFKVLAEPTQFEAAQSEADDSESDMSLRGLRVAWYTDDGVAPVSDEIRAAVQNAAKALADAGLEVIEVTPPGISKGSRLWIDLFSRAANSEIAALYQGREVEAGPQVARLLREFNPATTDFQEKIEKAERLAAAVLERERLREELLQWMRTTGLILAPVGATAAFEHGAERVASQRQVDQRLSRVQLLTNIQRSGIAERGCSCGTHREWFADRCASRGPAFRRAHRSFSGGDH